MASDTDKARKDRAMVGEEARSTDKRKLAEEEEGRASHRLTPTVTHDLLRNLERIRGRSAQTR